ncbi:hypothetical protein Leryth_005658 [Lithospermum erythrorhizon]|nr:hypothetical protein Leryth_005658 [Lithospermum erythrorhizon]
MKMMFFNIHKLLLIPILFTTILNFSILLQAQETCSRGCDLALGSYYVFRDNNFTFISQITGRQIPEILEYNKNSIPNQDILIAETRIIIPFSCECLDDRRGGRFLGHNFSYNIVEGDTYQRVAETYYANLTTAERLQNFNSYPANNIPRNAVLSVPVNCSCGNEDVDKRYGLFVTWPLRETDTLQSVADTNNLTTDLIQRYNPTVNFSSGRGLVYIPGKDKDGNYPPLNISSGYFSFHALGGLSSGAIAGISVTVIVVVLLLAGWLFFAYRKKSRKLSLLSKASEDQSNRGDFAAEGNIVKQPLSTGPSDGGLTGISVDKSVEFTYDELAKATDDFSIANKIGQGGFGAVYYAELRGEKAAIKKMDMQASREFLAELNVLTHVHHLNLVRLIGYCVEGSLFLVYEFIENGNLSQHLRGSAKVQIALDSARGLEYIHEHTVPVYIHRDIKSANILIDRNYHGKVADFGLTKLTEVGGNSLPTRLVGTFGYMPPEYARYGDVSPKVDVYAFGVVLYELISAKEAIVKPNGTGTTESKGLVALFEDVLSKPDSKEDLRQLVDPRLEDNYPLDSVYKLAQLAKACTHENPQLRPSMRSIVVALMTLSSSTEEWDIGSFYGNQGLVNLMSGR